MAKKKTTTKQNNKNQMYPNYGLASSIFTSLEINWQKSCKVAVKFSQVKFRDIRRDDE